MKRTLHTKISAPITEHALRRCVSGERVAAYVASAAIAFLLTACVTEPKVPRYDATWPEVTEATTATSGAIYHADHDTSIFENSTARLVGDTVTILLVESTNASKTSKTSTSKATSLDLPAPVILGNPVTIKGNPIGASMDHKSTFAGSGDSAQGNTLNGQITVTVAKRLPNGNLLVRGQKWLTLNQGSEFVRIQGIVRPIDIAADNSIASSKVADAMISYGGNGALADSNAPGLLSRFFNSKWMPF
jgi:flagellar L-ring protein FlgH